MEKNTKSSSKTEGIQEEIQKEISPVADGQELQNLDLEAEKGDAIQVNEDLNENSGLKTANKASKTPESKIDKDLHDEILEKLDIKQKAQAQDIQEKIKQETGKQEQKLESTDNDSERVKVKTQVQQAISQDFTKIQKLMESGLINSAQGQNLKKQVLKKAFDMLVQTEKAKRGIAAASEQSKQAPASVDKNQVFEEFGKSNPDFFTSDGRKEVLNYLKSDNVALGTDELSKISGIIRTLEQAAIDRYLQNAAHEKTLRESNESAKQRLTANAQKSGLSGNLSRTFTREQIGKMSANEFAKYESQIMEQLKKGLIK